jgi:hypothetical protein
MCGRPVAEKDTPNSTFTKTAGAGKREDDLRGDCEYSEFAMI